MSDLMSDLMNTIFSGTLKGRLLAAAAMCVLYLGVRLLFYLFKVWRNRKKMKREQKEDQRLRVLKLDREAPHRY
jgi:hypothetical protein